MPPSHLAASGFSRRYCDALSSTLILSTTCTQIFFVDTAENVTFKAAGRFASFDLRAGSSGSKFESIVEAIQGTKPLPRIETQTFTFEFRKNNTQTMSGLEPASRLYLAAVFKASPADCLQIRSLPARRTVAVAVQLTAALLPKERLFVG